MKIKLIVMLIFCSILLFSGCRGLDIFDGINSTDFEVGWELGEKISEEIETVFNEAGEGFSDLLDEQNNEYNNQNDDEVAYWDSVEGVRLADFDSSYFDGGTRFPRNSIYGEGQCTWYCYGRAYELGKVIEFDNKVKNSGMAEKWLDTVLYLDREKFNNRAIRSDCIAVSKSHGHVVYVEFVNNGIVYFSEANWPRDDKLNSKDGKIQKLPLDKFIKERHIDGYIYLR